MDNLVSQSPEWQFAPMSTLLEIENAVTSLPAPQQLSLLVWLQSLVATQPAATPAQSRSKTWLNKLAERRQRGVTAKAGTPLQQMMDDLRGE
jgi:hypothetical protein